MFNHPTFADSVAAPAGQRDANSTSGESDEILALARNAGMLVTLDGQVGREKYQSIVGSIASFMRFADAVRTTRFS
ncbi:hypothetical protein LJR029_000811 [Caballeronia sp. LjRoot29]|uniref:hypothetical protein n=1 Tax=Caballeronia sp. LjRoot29 TaxID=3342315 RepID=UPI003ECF2DBF